MIFVYGSLQRGQRNHGYLMGSRFVGAARTEAQYALVPVGEYVGLVSGGTQEIAGEVWSVSPSTVRRLDELENVESGLYERTAVHLQPPFRGVQAYVYGGRG